jgi:hypothetical protein
MGQAVGAAAAMAAARGIMPREMLQDIRDLQRALMHDDCYLPWVREELSPITRSARLVASQGDAEPVRDGVSRPVGDWPHSWTCSPGNHVAYLFEKPSEVSEVVLTLDSALEKLIAMSHHQADNQLTSTPSCVPRSFRIEGLRGGNWELLADIRDNHRRGVHVPVGQRLDGVRFVLDATWGAPHTRVFKFEAL